MTFFEKLEKYNIILASQSPRRKALMELSRIPFKVRVLPVDESFPGELKPEQVAKYLSKQKASVFKNNIPENSIVITADTIVVKDDKIINKAKTQKQAYEMLKELSGSVHKVITGVCISSSIKQIAFVETTKVYFNNISDDKIKYYINHFKPYDKAGAYGIQEWFGIIAEKRIVGSFYNVVGLPVATLVKKLEEFIDNLQ